MKRKILSLILVFAMTVSLLTVGIGAVEPTYGDTAGHWAESSIERWSGHGIIQGSNGLFDPNGQLTCAQLATILAKLLKLPAAKDAGFTDNTADAWYFDAINRCAAAGILNGNGDGTVTPDAPISRERAIVMLGRALGIEPIRKPDLTKYTDAAKVAPYAQGMAAAMIEAGIVGGVTADELAPQDNINRASTVTILDRAIGTYADKAGATVKADGKGLVLVVAENVKITGAPEGTKIVVADGATGLTVNGKSVSDDQTYIVPKATTGSGSSSGGSVHAHDYTIFVTDWSTMTTVKKCSCGATQTVVNSDTYYIANDTDLKAFRDSVNQGHTFAGKTIKLMADITVSDWTPIGQKGSQANKFMGTFDGNGKTVTIDGIASDLGQAFGGYAAFFGATKDATIQNLTVAGTISGKDVAGIIGKGESTALTNCHNKATITSTEGKAAGIAASFGGSLTNCTNSGVVTTSAAQPAGGLVAWCNTSTITECQNSGKVTVSGTGDSSQAGGLCGNLGSGSTVTNCSNSGTVSASLAGGVAGRASGADTKIIAFSNEGTVTGRNYAGGVIGDAKDGVTAQECTISGTISAANAAGGIFGSVHGNNSSAITNCAVTSCNVSATTENRAGKVVGILGGTVTLKLTGNNVTDDVGCFSEVTLTIVGRTPNSIDFTSLPTEAQGSLSGFVHENAGHRKEITVKSTDDDATEAKYIYYGVNSSDSSKFYKWESVLYCIANTEQIAQIRDRVNQGQTFAGKTIKLMADITVSDWTPIGQKGSQANKFMGTFDGNGKTVTIDGIASDLGQAFGGYAAFFGATKDATIQNLTVAGTISGKDVAGIIGKGESTALTNCHNKATITSTEGKAAGIAASFGGSLTNCTNSGVVTTSAAQPAGGLVAWCNTSTITECQNSGKVTVSGTGDSSQAGGLCGNLGSGSTVTNCSNSGTVSASLAGGVAGRASGADTKIIAFSNEGTVTGRNYAGGVIGDAKDGVTAQECTISGTISAANAAGGIFGSVHGNNSSAITNCAVTSCNVSATTENRAGKVVGILGGTVTLKLTGNNVTDDVGCFSEVTLTIVGRTPNSIDFTSLPTEAQGSLSGFVHENAGHRKEITVKSTDDDATEAKYIYYGVNSSDDSKNYKWETESSGT